MIVDDSLATTFLFLSSELAIVVLIGVRLVFCATFLKAVYRLATDRLCLKSVLTYLKSASSVYLKIFMFWKLLKVSTP